MNRNCVISIVYICITILIISIFAISRNYNTLWLIILYFFIEKLDKKD